MKGQGKPVKFRRNWGNVKPIQRIKDSDKLYDRNRQKKDYETDATGDTGNSDNK